MKYTDEFEAEQAGGASFLGHIPAVLWQRRWWIIAPLAVLSVAGVVGAFLVPTRYTSTATLLVQSASLPQAIAAGSPDDVVDRRIARIREQVLSRPELIELVNRYQLYPRQRARAALSELINTMRGNVAIAPLGAESQGVANGGSTIAFTLSYTYDDPAKAQAVAQDLTEQVLQLDATRTTQQGDAAVLFLTDQQRGLQTQIAQLEQQLAVIKGANGQILTNAGLSVGSGNGGGYDIQIAALQRENSQLLSQRNLVQTQDTRDPMVASAEAQLAGAQAVYSDDHPDVKLAKQRLAEAKQLAKKNVAKIPTEAIDDEVAFNNRQIAALRSAEASDRAQASAAIGAQSRAPLVLQQIAQLQQRLDNLNTQNKNISDQLLAAKAGVKAENEQLGERLSVVDPPVVPDRPSSPQRWILALGGPVAGLALGLVLALAIEILLRPIRDPVALTELFGEAPLGVIPTVAATPRTPARGRLFRWFGRRGNDDE